MKRMNIKPFLLLLLIFLIPTAVATTTEGYSWGDKIIYDDGSVEINQHGNNYQIWEGLWESKDLMKVGTTHYPYLIVDGGTQWTLTKSGEYLTLPQNSVYSYQFDPYHIGMTITATPAQLNSISTYQNVSGEDVWYIVIPDQVVNEVKMFNWDNKLPRVSNGSTVYGSLFYLNQSNFEYHRIGDELRFYYNQVTRDFGTASSEITFEFNSWYVVGDGGDAWGGNVTVDANTTIVQCTGNIELQDAVPDFISKWRFDDNSTLDENTTNSNDGTNYGATYNSSGYYGGAFDFDGVGDYVDCGNNTILDAEDGLTVCARIKVDAIDTVMAIVTKDDETSNNDPNYALDMVNGKVRFFGYQGTAAKGITVPTFTFAVNIWYHIVGTFDGTNCKIYSNGSEVDSAIESATLSKTNSSLKIGKRTQTIPYYLNGSIDTVRIYNRALSPSEINQTRDNHHKVTGNLTQNVFDSGAGNEIKQIGWNGTKEDGITNVNLYFNGSTDNFSTSSGYITIRMNSTSGEMYDVPAGYRYCKPRDNLNTTNASLTPEIENIRILYGAIEDTAIRNLHATPFDTYALLEWDSVANTTNYTLSFPEPTILWLGNLTPPVLDGVEDTEIVNFSQKGVLRTPNPIESLDYDYIYSVKDNNTLYMGCTSKDNDDSANDDSISVYFDFDQDGLTHGVDIGYELDESGLLKRYRWTNVSDSWGVWGGSGATSAVGGAGTNNVIYEIFVPLSELPKLQVGTDIDMIVQRESTDIATVQSYFPSATGESITNTSGWQYMYVSNSTEAEPIITFNTTNNYYNITPVDIYSWYDVGVKAYVDGQYGEEAFVEFISLDYPRWTISGYITDSVSGLGIPDAVVTITDTFTLVYNLTDSDGYYISNGLHNDSYTVTANKTSYAENSINVTVVGANLTNQNIIMIPSVTDIMIWDKLLEIETQNEDIKDDIKYLNSIIWVASLLAALVVISVLRKKLEEYE